jgi:hypothetical protein
VCVFGIFTAIKRISLILTVVLITITALRFLCVFDICVKIAIDIIAYEDLEKRIVIFVCLTLLLQVSNLDKYLAGFVEYYGVTGP